MKTIWKFTIHGAENIIEMPSGARIVHVAAPIGILWLWAMVDTEAEKRKRRIVVLVTGEPMPDDVWARGRHLETFANEDGFVLHIFDMGEVS